MTRQPNASVKKILGVYKILKSVNGTSKKLHVSKEYISKVLNEAGIEQYNKPSRGKVGRTFEINKKSQLVEWVKNNPGVSLPRDDVKLAELTGINKSAIKMYLYRRKQKISKYVKGVICNVVDMVNCDLQNHQEDLSYAIHLEETFKDFLSGNFNIYVDKYTTEIKVKISAANIFVYKNVGDFRHFVEDIKMIFYSSQG